MEKCLNFLKVDKNLIFSDEKGKVNPNLSMSFEFTIKNIIIALFEILTYISKNSGDVNNHREKYNYNKRIKRGIFI